MLWLQNLFLWSSNLLHEPIMICVCWTNSSGTMLEKTDMKTGKSSAGTSHHKAVPAWCKGIEKEQQIWQRLLGTIEKEQAWRQTSLLTLTCLVPMAKDHTTLQKSKANPSNLLLRFKSILHHHVHSWWQVLGRAAHSVLSPTGPPGGQSSGRGPRPPLGSTASASCVSKDVTRQEGGQWCAQSKRRGSHVAQQADCAILKYFISADFYFLCYYNWRLGNFFSCG